LWSDCPHSFTHSEVNAYVGVTSHKEKSRWFSKEHNNNLTLHEKSLAINYAERIILHCS